MDEIKINIEKIVEQRKEFNLKILEQLKIIVERWPELRFGQILAIFNLNVDKFNEEPNITLYNIKEIIKDLDLL